MKKPLIVLIFIIFTGEILAQDQNLLSLHENKVQFSNRAMTVLGSWAILNIVSGFTLQAQRTGSRKYFYQGNAYWNLVNLGIAGFSIWQVNHTNLPETILEFWKNENTYQRILLFNAGLDLAYMASGWALIERSSGLEGNRADQFKGFGQALILQGSFLFIFDAILYILRTSNNSTINQLMANIDIMNNGFYFSWKF